MIPRDYEEPMSFWEWVRTLLLTMVPVLGFLLVIYWACSSHGKASRRNFIRAYLFLCFVGSLVVIALLAAAPGFFPAYARNVADGLDSLPIANSSKNSPITPDPTKSEIFPPSKPPTTPANEPMRSFRSTDGRTIEARVVSLTDDTVTIRRADGREFTTELTRFSPEDVEYFMRLRHGGGAFD